MIERRKLQLTRTTTTETVADVWVTFPAYSKHDLSDDHGECVVYRRLDAGGVLCAVKVGRRYACGREEEVSLDVEVVDTAAVGREPGYYLGWGEYASDAAEFDAALAKAGALVAALRRTCDE